MRTVFHLFFLEIFLLTLFPCLNESLYAQNFSWARGIGGQSHDHGTSATTDSDGNIYVTGMFRHITDFDPGAGVYNLITTGNADVFILKLDPNGNLIWAKQVGSDSDDDAESISIDGNNHIVISGFYQSNNDFDPGPGVYSLDYGHNAFMLKLDTSGTFIWATSLGASGNYDYTYSQVIDNNNDIILTGYFNDSVDADPGIPVYNIVSNGYRDAYIQKLSSAGNFIWAKSIGGTNYYDVGYSVTTDAVNNVYVTGTFQSTVDLDPGPGVLNITSSGFFDSYILKLDASGNFLWVKSIGGNDRVTSTAIHIDGSGNILLTGSFESDVDFDPGPGTYNLVSNGDKDAFVLKLDPAGNIVWVTQTGGGYNYGNTIFTDNNGRIYITGVFRDSADFDPGPGINMQYAVGQNHIFIQTLNPDGSLYRIMQLEGDASIEGFSCMDMFGNIITTGSFGGAVDFDMGWGSYIMQSISGITSTLTDIFIHKMDSSATVGISELLSDQEIKIFPNPVSEFLEIVSNKDVEWEFTLFDQSSRKILSRIFRGSEQIDVAGLSKGMYLYEMVNKSGNRYQGKIIR